MEDFFSINTIRAPISLEPELIALGLDYKSKHTRLELHGIISDYHQISTELSISDKRYPVLKELADKYNIKGGYYTKYSKQDYAQAEWLEVAPVSWLGYPKPESTWREVTYESNNPDFCQKCGIGIVQIAPFRFSASHRGGKTISFFHPGWVYDELFVRTNVREVLNKEAITGFDYLPVLQAGSKLPFDDILQIKVNTIMPASLNPADFKPIQCSVCRRTKYVSSEQAKKARRKAFDGQPDMVKSFEWFGGGHSASKKIFVSQRFAGLIWKNKWRGIKLKPVVFIDDDI
ncbi:MAG: hypothetical protein OT477_11890 [Chloroflexi bacterium]|nr:hypothetical protein [Chloroflexota bacterium]